MPSASYPYAVGRIKIIEGSLLGESKLARLAELSYLEALKQLNDWGFAAEFPDKTDVDALIDFRRKEIRDTIFELTPNEKLTNLFWLEFDAINLKLFLKSRVLGGEDIEPSRLTGGIFEPLLISACVDEKKYEPLGEPLNTLMNAVEERIKLGPDPRVISAMVDRAVFAFIFASLKGERNAFCKKYFMLKADFINVASLLRARALGWNAHELSEMLVDGGEIDKKKIVDCIDEEAERLPKLLTGFSSEKDVKAALGAYIGGSVNGATDSLSRSLLSLVEEEKNDSFGIGPIANYLLKGEYECRELRRMFAKKRAGRTV